MRRLSLAIATGLALAAIAARAQAPNVVTADLILTIAQVADAQISPDGATVVYQVARPRRADDPPGGARAELWTMPAAGGEARRLTQAEDRSPRWSPDGKRIAFLGRRGDSAALTQVHLLDMSGGESRPLTNAPTAVASFKWSPDGRWIGYTYTDPKTDQERKDEAQGKDWTVVDRNFKHTRLYRMDVATGKSELVTRADLTVHDFDWSPDSQQLVIGAAPTPTIDDSFMAVRLHIVPAAGGTPEPFLKTEGKLGFPRWSPDGRTIAWLGATTVDDPYAGSVFVAPVRRASGGEDRTNTTTEFDGTATWLGWQPGAGDTVTFTAAEHQDSKLYLMQTSSRARRAVTAPGLVIVGMPSFSADGKRVAFVAHSPTHPNEVFAGDVSGIPSRLSTLNPQLANVQLGTQEVVSWKAKDGWTIEGVLVKPVGFRAGQRYPLILQPHGGPESADPNGWNGSYSRWGQMLAGAGYLTLYPNYRGSIGRGVAFSKADHRDLMGKEFQDMLDGIDHLVAQGLADPNRVGIGGGSYGGYTSAWATTFASDRFKAAIPWMGISNWISMTGTSDIFLENSTVHWNLVMYQNYEKYWERSPLKYIDRAKTPTLIIHGAVDPRVPPGQSLELYTALKWKGVPVEYVTYPREGHGVAERAHQEDFMRRVLAFFDKYLK
jgi:dipeptidyl aminopeptidase/acylaminoacyl peptidase